MTLGGNPPLAEDQWIEDLIYSAQSTRHIVSVPSINRSCLHFFLLVRFTFSVDKTSPGMNPRRPQSLLSIWTGDSGENTFSRTSGPKPFSVRGRRLSQTPAQRICKITRSAYHILRALYLYMQLLDFEINTDENTLISKHECIWGKNSSWTLSFFPGLYC